MAMQKGQKAQAPAWDKAELDGVFRGDRKLGARFVNEFSPVLRDDIRRRCPWQIRVRGGAAVDEWTNDHLHEVFLYFFNNKSGDPEKGDAGGHGRLVGFDPQKGALGPYLRRITFNFISSQLRKEIPELRLTELPDHIIDEGTPFPVELLEDDDLCRKLRAYFEEHADEDEQKLFELLTREPQLTAAQIGEEMGLRTNTVHQRAKRLREKLARFLEELLAERPAVLSGGAAQRKRGIG